MMNHCDHITLYARVHAPVACAADPAPGVGPILGTTVFNGRAYAVRSDGDKPLLWMADGNGWKSCGAI